MVHALLPGTKKQTPADGQEGAACRCMQQVTSVLWEDLELNMKYYLVGLGRVVFGDTSLMCIYVHSWD